jgi:Flp pilus assembly protein TadB
MNGATRATLVAVGFLFVARIVRPGGSRVDAGDSIRGKRWVSRRRTRKATASEWAAFLDTTSTEVRSGSSLIAALAHSRLRHPALAARVFSFDGDADADLAVVAQSVSAALELGGPVAATLHHGAALLRERAAQRSEAIAYSAQARLSAKVLTAVPLVFTAWSAATSATFRQAITSSTGLTAAVTGLACNAVGWWWMRRIINRATP